MAERVPELSREQADELERKVQAICLQDSVERAGMLCFLFVLIFGAYGATSLDFIRRFAPEATYWSNIWPRLAFNSLPLLALGLYLRYGKASHRAKFYLWITVFSIVVHVSAWVFVWPVALARSADILAFVHAANTYLFAFVYAVVAPPRRLLAPFTAIFGTIFVAPLFAVSYLSRDPVVTNLIVNDSIFTLVSGIFISQMINRLRVKLARLELGRTAEASKFLGPVVSKAIFENQVDKLERVTCKGFVASIDVRGSTELQKRDKERWLAFRTEYFALVADIVTRCNGYIQKTVGDCHVINFGVMDYSPDLSDIPGLEAEEARAEERRLQHASDSAMDCLEEIMRRFNLLVQRHYPEGDGPQLGAGLDKGVVERGVQGDGNQLELDVNGDPVNCSNRLQEYSKAIRDQFARTSSLLVLSPFASDYLDGFGKFKRVSTIESPVRSYDEQIKWVLVREFALETATGSRAGDGERKAS